MNGSHDDVDGILTSDIAPSLALQSSTINSFPKLERSLIPSVNKPTILLGLTHKVQCSSLVSLSSEFSGLLGSPYRRSSICLPTLENGYNVQQKGLTICNNGHKTTARVRRPAPQSLAMNKLGYLSMLPFHSLPFRNKGPTDNSPRSHTEYTLFFPSRADYWASTIASLTCLSKSSPHVPFQVSKNHLAHLPFGKVLWVQSENSNIYKRCSD